MIDQAQVYLTEFQLAERQQRSVKTLRNQRVIGGGVPFVKMGRTVRYRLADVIDWERVRTTASTSQTSVEGGFHGIR